MQFQISPKAFWQIADK